MIFKIIDSNSNMHSIDTMCNVLNYPRSSFYDKQKEKPQNKWEAENKKLREAILQIYNDSGKIYGAPKIREKLKAQGYSKISLKRVQRHMKKLGIRSIVVKKYRPNANKKVYEQGENLLKRDFTTTKINEKWVADITYIYSLKDGWSYLASIMDLHTQKIVGYSFSETMDTSLVLKALENAITTQKPNQGLIIHSDRGSQYTSLFQYIEGFYNRKRIHSSIDYMTPEQYENICRAA